MGRKRQSPLKSIHLINLQDKSHSCAWHASLAGNDSSLEGLKKVFDAQRPHRYYTCGWYPAQAGCAERCMEREMQGIHDKVTTYRLQLGVQGKLLVGHKLVGKLGPVCCWVEVRKVCACFSLPASSMECRWGINGRELRDGLHAINALCGQSQVHAQSTKLWMAALMSAACAVSHCICASRASNTCKFFLLACK